MPSQCSTRHGKLGEILLEKGLIRWEIPRLCRGGSRSLTVPGVCFTRVTGVANGHSAPRKVTVLLLTGCDQAPLRGQQP
jgi:hypothetical protein